MGWVKLDDAFFTDQKAIRAGADGRLLYLAGLCHVARNRDDGHIDREALPVIAALAGVPQDVAARLEHVGLWLPLEDGWDVHNYLRYNPSRAQIEREAEANAERQRRWRERQDTVGNADSNAVSNSTPSRPVPEIPNSSSSASEKAGPQAVDDDVEEVLRLFADRKLAAANGTVKNPKPWRSKVLANARVELAGQARDWLDRYDVKPAEIADALAAGSVPPAWAHCRRRPA